jgi:hypothetical protein
MVRPAHSHTAKAESCDFKIGFPQFALLHRNLKITEKGRPAAFPILPILCLILFGSRILCTTEAFRR